MSIGEDIAAKLDYGQIRGSQAVPSREEMAAAIDDVIEAAIAAERERCARLAMSRHDMAVQLAAESASPKDQQEWQIAAVQSAVIARMLRST